MTTTEHIAHITALIDRATTEEAIVGLRRAARLASAWPAHKTIVRAVDKAARARLRTLGIAPTMRA